MLNTHHTTRFLYLINDCFVWQMMSQAEGQQRDLIRSIECLPVSGHLTSLDQDLLMLKATSMATMNCLNDCFHILQLQHASQQKGSLPAGGYRCSQRAELCNKYESFLSCKNTCCSKSSFTWAENCWLPGFLWVFLKSDLLVLGRTLVHISVGFCSFVSRSLWQQLYKCNI